MLDRGNHEGIALGLEDVGETRKEPGARRSLWRLNPASE